MSKANSEINQALGRAWKFLAAGQTPNGGWGYTSTAQSFAEPTSYALLALAGQPNDPSRSERERLAIDWLTKNSKAGPLVMNEKDRRGIFPASLDVWGTIISYFALIRLNIGSE
ncbi:MAG TPA: hypothetical protein VEF04_13815, partial [Blastocatellia bacterium]|nr:hypothetical protein [Blastocatellia bacterium]